MLRIPLFSLVQILFNQVLNFEIVTAVVKKPEPVQIAKLLAVIGKQANKVYEAFSWGSLDRTKRANVLQKCDDYCRPKHNVIYDGSCSIVDAKWLERVLVIS